MKLNGLKFALGALLPCMVVSSPSLAADPIEEAAPYSWSGLYIGTHAGYAWGRGDLTDSFCDGVTPGNCTEDDPESEFSGLPGTWIAHTDSGSFVGGVHIGYNHQFSSGFVLGAESDLDFGRVFKGPFFFGENFGYTDPTGSGTAGEIKLGLSGSARVRAGIAVDRWLPFVTGGVAFAKYEATITRPDDDEYPRSGDGNLVGWTLGGGVNYALTDHVILGAEYRFTNFGSDSVGLTNPANDTDVWAHTVDLKTHDIRLSASFKF
jgi:outer membrane immunogenic protein